MKNQRILLPYFRHFTGHLHETKGNQHRQQIHENEQHGSPDIRVVRYKPQDKLTYQEGTDNGDKGV